MKARRHGLVVRQKTYAWEVVGSNPRCGDHFSCTIHLDQYHGSKNCGKFTWHCCRCCNPANGRVEFEDGWLIKPSFITMDEMKACQLTRTKLQKNKNKYLPIMHLNTLFKFEVMCLSALFPARSDSCTMTETPTAPCGWSTASLKLVNRWAL